MTKYCVNCGTKSEVGANFCGACGAKTDGSNTNLQSKASEDLTKISVRNCPSCHQMDSIQTVATIVDTGTGSSIGFGIAGPIIPTHGHLMGGVIASRNSSALAARLSGYAQPDVGSNPAVKVGVMSGLLTLVILLIALPPTSGYDGTPPDIWSWVFEAIFLSAPSIFVGLIVGFLLVKPLRISGNNRIKKSREKWVENFALMRKSKYCSRCDLVFSENFSGTPEEYTKWCFSR